MLLMKIFFREICWERILGYRKVMMLDDYFIDSDLNWIIENLMGMPLYISSVELDEWSAGIFKMDCPKELALDVAKRKSLTVLIIWALVSNRGKLAVYLWRHVDQPVISKGKKIVKLCEQFADMAVGVFDLCYNDMPSKAYDALNLKNKDWGSHSLIDMAALAMNKNLVAHPCCQKWLTNTFMGNIKMRDLTWGFMTFLTTSRYLITFLSVNREETGRSHLLKYHYPPMWQMIYWMWSAPITKFWVSNALPNTPMFGTILEIVYILLYVVFIFSLRIRPINDPYGGKILMCLGLLFFYYRMIFIYLPISSTLGPLLYRVKEMVRNSLSNCAILNYY
ncbi:transient receptor potential cation channel subfamily M member 2 [Caerostris extrusa]|uniref:Transient receptor potential cation channel subfamily M member 2 n=1 Tax=Caerostris extrusa TaxID=172846 RepID=A0AAV4R9R1_CAEEX|nr:transient receptor potential cation channel subfamily M member 2 [Caerostris extrusa]